MNYIICFPTSFPEKFIFISFPTKFLLCKAVSEISYLKIVTNAGSLFFYYFINFSKTPFLSLFCSLFILSSLFISQLLPLHPLCLSAKKKRQHSKPKTIVQISLEEAEGAGKTDCCETHILIFWVLPHLNGSICTHRR